MYFKLVQAGDLVETYIYEHSPVPFAMRARTSKGIRIKRRTESKRADNVYKAVKSFRHLVRTNLSKGVPHLLTLTMRDVLDIKHANRCYSTFGQRLRRSFGRDISWVAVAEFQSRGAIHYHALVWGLPEELGCIMGTRYEDKAHKKKFRHGCPVHRNCERTTRTLANLWGHGYVDCIKTNGDTRVASYMAKYMSKSMQDARLVCKRAYFPSRNLLRPVQVNTPAAFDIAFEELGLKDIPCLSERSYGTKWLGRGVYKSYSLLTHGSKINMGAGENLDSE